MKILILFTLSILLNLQISANEFPLIQPISVEKATPKAIKPIVPISKVTAPQKEEVVVPVAVVLKNDKQEPEKNFTETQTLDINFVDRQATIIDADIQKIDDFKDYMNENEDYQVVIYSYTDSIGEAPDNLLLSQQRAKMIKNALIDRGISSSRLTAIGKGEKEPIANNMYKKGRNINNRIEVLITK